MERKEQILATLREGVGMVLKDVKIIKGEARFTSVSTVEVEGETLSAPEIIIATGSRPAALDIPGKELASLSTRSRKAL